MYKIEDELALYRGSMPALVWQLTVSVVFSGAECPTKGAFFTRVFVLSWFSFHGVHVLLHFLDCVWSSETIRLELKPLDPE